MPLVMIKIMKEILLKQPTTIPPTIPEIIPENKGAPLANAIPRHNGKATKKTTKPEAKSDLRSAKRLIFFVILEKINYKNCISILCRY